MRGSVARADRVRARAALAVGARGVRGGRRQLHGARDERRRPGEVLRDADGARVARHAHDEDEARRDVAQPIGKHDGRVARVPAALQGHARPTGAGVRVRGGDHRPAAAEGTRDDGVREGEGGGNTRAGKWGRRGEGEHSKQYSIRY